MYGMAKTLIVVYKDEMLMNQLEKMVETKDDGGDEQIVGTRDASLSNIYVRRKHYRTKLIYSDEQATQCTGEDYLYIQPRQTAVYRKVGFNKMENYGPYVSMPESLCMMKEL